jgi:hypothetical protein
MVSNLQANCNCTKTVAKLNQKLGKFDRKNLNSIRAFDSNQSLFYQQFNSVLANQKKLLMILLFKEMIKRLNLTQLI